MSSIHISQNMTGGDLMTDCPFNTMPRALGPLAALYAGLVVEIPP